MINVLITLNRRAAVPVKTGACSLKEMVILLHDWVTSTTETLVTNDLELNALHQSPEVMVAVTEAYMGDSAFAQIDLQFLFEVPQTVMERMATVLGVGIEHIANEQFASSAIPTNVMLVAWWATPGHTFRYDTKSN